MNKHELPTTPFIEQVIKPEERRMEAEYEQAVAQLNTATQQRIAALEALSNESIDDQSEAKS